MKEKQERKPISKQEKLLSYVIGSLVLILLLALVITVGISYAGSGSKGLKKYEYSTISRYDINNILHQETNKPIEKFNSDVQGPSNDSYDPSDDTFAEFKKKEYYVLLIDLNEKNTLKDNKTWKDIAIEIAKNKKENVGFSVYDFSERSNNRSVGVSNKVILQEDDNTLNELLGLEKQEKTTEFGENGDNLEYVEKKKHANKNAPILLRFVDGSLDVSSSIFSKESDKEKLDKAYTDIFTKLQTLKKESK